MLHLVLRLNLVMLSSGPSLCQHRDDCDAYLTAPRGHLHTPNFPGAYPSPARCQWVIEASPGSKVAVYFTQFYMRRGVSAADYTYYSRHVRSGVGRFDFGVIRADDEPTYLVSNQHILVLTLDVRSSENVHLRVREHFLEASGFNITYEMIPGNATIRGDACIYHHCSFTGTCYASQNYARYACACIDGYFGDECQYDDTCGPVSSSSSSCHNGGTCRYYIGSSVRTCECLPGYTGAKCETLLLDSSDKTEENKTESVCKNPDHTSPDGYVSIFPRRRLCHSRADPGLILSLEVSEAMPVGEGTPLLVACIVQSPLDDAHVEWLKDGFPVLFEASGDRIWRMKVPRDSRGRLSFLLGLDWTDQHDAGSITCEASSGDRSENLTAPVSVRPPPGLLLEPTSSTVVENDSLHITCVSRDVVYGSSLYGWRKDGRELRRRGGDGEVVEDLYPGGTRLLVGRAARSANYSCEMRTSAKLLRQTSRITVVSAADFKKMTCRQEKKDGVRWRTTAVGAEDMSQCPPNYTGQIRRRCVWMPGGIVDWQDADFSTCLSPTALSLEKEIKSWKMGYKKRQLQDVLKEMRDWLSNNLPSMHSAEGEPFVDMLSEADTSLLEMSDDNTWKIFLSIVSMLFHSNLVQKLNEKFKLLLLVRKINLAFGIRSESLKQFQSDCLRVHVFKMMKSFTRNLQFPISFSNDTTYNIATAHRLKMKFKILNRERFGNTTVVMSTVVYKCFTLTDENDSLERNEHEKFFPLLSIDSRAHYGILPHIEILVYPYFDAEARYSIQMVCHRKVIQEYLNQEIHRCDEVHLVGNASICKCTGNAILSFYIKHHNTVELENHYLSITLYVITGAVVLALFIFRILLKSSCHIRKCK